VWSRDGFAEQNHRDTTEDIAEAQILKPSKGELSGTSFVEALNTTLNCPLVSFASAVS
jgi:hypothetical protein